MEKWQNVTSQVNLQKTMASISSMLSLLCSLLFIVREASCHIMSCPMEKPRGQQWITMWVRLEADPPLVKLSDGTTAPPKPWLHPHGETVTQLRYTWILDQQKLRDNRCLLHLSCGVICCTARDTRPLPDGAPETKREERFLPCQQWEWYDYIIPLPSLGN